MYDAEEILSLQLPDGSDTLHQELCGEKTEGEHTARIAKDLETHLCSHCAEAIGFETLGSQRDALARNISSQVLAFKPTKLGLICFRRQPETDTNVDGRGHKFSTLGEH